MAKFLVRATFAETVTSEISMVIEANTAKEAQRLVEEEGQEGEDLRWHAESVEERELINLNSVTLMEG